MSFVPGFAPDALSQWLALDFESQEAVLDLIEQIAIDPPSRALYVSDTVIQSAGVRRYLFVQAVVDRQRQRIIVVGVTYWQRPV